MKEKAEEGLILFLEPFHFTRSPWQFAGTGSDCVSCVPLSSLIWIVLLLCPLYNKVILVLTDIDPFFLCPLCHRLTIRPLLLFFVTQTTLWFYYDHGCMVVCVQSTSNVAHDPSVPSYILLKCLMKYLTCFVIYNSFHPTFSAC